MRYKVLFNARYGGFGISEKAKEKMIEYGMSEETLNTIYYSRKFRSNAIAIKVFEELGEEFGDKYSNIECIDVPIEYDYFIDEYDGFENVELRPRKEYLRKLIQSKPVDEIIEYLEKTDCFQEE